MISSAILNSGVKYWLTNYELLFIYDTNITKMAEMKKKIANTEI